MSTSSSSAPSSTLTPSTLATIPASSSIGLTFTTSPSYSTVTPSNTVFPSETSASATATSSLEGTRGYSPAPRGYYYALIAVFFVLLGAALWFLHQQRRKRFQRSIQGRRMALARDLQNGQLPPNSYRSTRGTRRSHRARHSAVSTRRDEGLDEQGEAPPPYKPAGQRDAPSAMGAEITVPLQTLQRDGTAIPPEYHEYYAPPEREGEEDWNRGRGSSRI